MRHETVSGKMLGAFALLTLLAAPLAWTAPNTVTPQAEIPACCAAPQEAANFSMPEGLPWSGTDLRNKVSPVTGGETDPAHSVSVYDQKAKIAWQVYFSSEKALGKTTPKKMNALIAKAFYGGEGKDGPSFPEPILKLDNKMCPVSGVGGTGKEKFVFDKTAAVNCTAGACSISDGFRQQYNGVEFRVCCSSCANLFAEKPATFLPNLEAYITESIGGMEIKQGD